MRWIRRLFTVHRWRNWFRKGLEARCRRKAFRVELSERNKVIADTQGFELARILVADAFGLADNEIEKLSREDELEWIYAGVAGAFSDCMEFEMLTLNVEQELKRELSHSEVQSVQKIGDLADLLEREVIPKPIEHKVQG